MIESLCRLPRGNVFAAMIQLSGQQAEVLCSYHWPMGIVDDIPGWGHQQAIGGCHIAYPLVKVHSQSGAGIWVEEPGLLRTYLY